MSEETPSIGWIVMEIDGIRTIEYNAIPENKIFGEAKTMERLRTIITETVHLRTQLENLRKAYREDHDTLHQIKELLRDVK